MVNGNKPGLHPDIPRTPDLNERPRCSTCYFYRWQAPALIGDGKCAWVPPPKLAQLYHMLAAEPATQIDYDDIFVEMPNALKRGACSVWQPRQDA